jgi:hypothetical protein
MQVRVPPQFRPTTARPRRPATHLLAAVAVCAAVLLGWNGASMSPANAEPTATATATPTPTPTPTPTATVGPVGEVGTCASPGTCSATEPSFRDTYVSTCTGITTTITNTGRSAATFGLLRVRAGIDGVSSVPGQERITLRPGRTHTATVPAVGGRRFSINWQPTSELDVRDDLTAWVKPASCAGTTPTPNPTATADATPNPTATADATSAPKATFRDTCTGVTTTVTNGGTATDTVSLIRRQTGVDPTDGVPGQQHVRLQPGQRHTATVTPAQGRGFSLRWQSDSVLDIGDAFHRWDQPAGCAGLAGLPLTGASTLGISAAGLLLTLAGLGTVWLVRRRPAAVS